MPSQRVVAQPPTPAVVTSPAPPPCVLRDGCAVGCAGVCFGLVSR